MEGGHTVPIDKIISRYARSMANVEPLASLCDRAYVYDNSVDGTEARLVARYQDGRLRKVYGALPGWVQEVVASAPKHEHFEST
jgi:predicted ABC-type ATPase